MSARSTTDRGARLLLGLASVAVAFAAADTYVVVLALVDMMAGVGLSPDQLQRAAPIISGFLLGYVAMLPLIGRIADLRGRVPVLTASLVIFAVGSIVTAAAYDMPSMVTGRFLQGVGGGGLVPATLALVADLYPRERRGVPLGLVSAVQEIGSVVGPLYGAAVLAFADWRAIFLINLAVGLVLAAAIATLSARGGASSRPPRARRGWPDLVGILLLVLLLVAGGLVFQPPNSLRADLDYGRLFIPFVDGGGRWLTPVGAATVVLALLLVARTLTARRPLVDLRAWGRSLREADVTGAAYLAVALGGVILAFATADPKVQVFSDQGLWYLLGAGVASIAFVVHLRRASDPLLPRGALAARPAWGSVVVSFFIGAALIAALIDVPLFARTTTYQDSQLLAALVLVRFLVALPVGAVVGGYLTRTVPAGVVTAVGMAMAAVAFVMMSRWDVTALESWTATVPLVVGGLGFGLALAPVNAAVLASTADAVHGLASAMVVVARMVGMLIGISALTTIGLRRYYAEQADIPPIQDVCAAGTTRCAEYSDLLRTAGIAQEQTVFLGAAACALVAAVLALVLLRGADTRAAGHGRDVGSGVPAVG
ncbi:MFS-type drug efflux transporter P55 [Nocardioides dokdonensis FR1436]|uniref:MFS-type drug efflux transporter P55 n=1 Tax=Nocardioides dokdonensis FR1436 TaxID=1300347 RepID=A0A1A9GNZ9_9ACTN|nr:MFS transporter [Nocardioides dokdonensis]ANH40018.1 MFS-type drug efflux transporter P55 [Nocardioides dokdonensis FR1436]